MRPPSCWNGEKEIEHTIWLMRFAPTATGAAKATLTITDSGAQSLQSVSLSGTGNLSANGSLRKACTAYVARMDGVAKSTPFMSAINAIRAAPEANIRSILPARPTVR